MVKNSKIAERLVEMLLMLLDGDGYNTLKKNIETASFNILHALYIVCLNSIGGL